MEFVCLNLRAAAAAVSLCVYIIERNTVGMSAVTMTQHHPRGSDALLCIYGTWPILVMF